MEEILSGRWVLLCWALAAAFFGVSFFYAMQGSLSGWLIWFVLSGIWVKVATENTIRYLRERG